MRYKYNNYVLLETIREFFTVPTGQLGRLVGL